MGKRKGRKETPISNQENGETEREEAEEEEGGGKGGGFFSCYLLTSLCPRFKGHTYIGFTVNPRRRIRQHNGEIGSGAWRTKRKRPWEMVLCIYGFPTNVAALQFEWAWQHPVESLAVRKAAASFKSLSGLANKIKLAHTMLTLPSWQSLNLTVNFFSTKYQKHISGCPTLPEQMRTTVCSMDDLPCYNENIQVNDDWDFDEECDISGSSQEPTQENSTELVGKSHSPPSNHDELPFEEIFQKPMNQENAANLESSECFTNTSEGRKRNSPFTREENPGHPFFINDFPEKPSSSFASSYTIENVYLEDSCTDSDKPNALEKHSTTALVVEKDRFLSKNSGFVSCDVEIIDVFTPSPCHTIKSCIKKRKPTAYPEIIDLTKSPMYV